MLLKILVYGYVIGVRSSRKLVRRLERDVVFRYPAANQRPNFRTISDFRKTRKGWLQGYNAQAVVDCESQVIVAQDVTNDANGEEASTTTDAAGFYSMEVVTGRGAYAYDVVDPPTGTLCIDGEVADVEANPAVADIPCATMGGRGGLLRESPRHVL